MVNGAPVIVYPGGCRRDDGSGDGNAYSVAVPLDPEDRLMKEWRRLGPIINDTDNDPSEAWQTEGGEWRLIGHGGGGGERQKNVGAPMWATGDPTMLSDWYLVGHSPLPPGECQNLYLLPSLYPGTSLPPGDILPSHVHHTGGLYMLGTWKDGAPGTGDLHAGEWLQTPGVPFVQFLEDHGWYYASKGFNDNSTGVLRRILYGWNKAMPATHTLRLE